MNGNLYQLIEQSVQLELNVADVYLFFYKTFDEDKSFWWQLVVEEQNHAALLKGGRETFLGNNEFPAEVIASDLDELKKANQCIKEKLASYLIDKPARKEAFEFALYLEEAAGEAHFQEQMSGTTDNAFLKILQQLNSDDIDHAARIREYMRRNGLGSE